MRILLLAGLIATPASAADLTLVGATLSSSGVAQYDYVADPDGPAILTLDVPLSDVDDVLKSLRVSDPAGPSSIRLAGLEPLTEAFRALPFGQDALASSDTLLSALVGAEIRLPQEGVTKRIISVAPETTALPHQSGMVTRHRLTLATPRGIETLILEDTASIELVSDALRAQLAAALTAVAAHSAKDRRTIEIVLPASGKRHVTVSDVLSAPVWKPSYRIAPGKDGDHVHLIGEAVMENLTGQDWTNLAVTLTSGQPVLYRQSLYQSLFADRPEAPVDVPARVAPRLDRGAIPMAAFAPSPQSPPPPAPSMQDMQRTLNIDGAARPMISAEAPSMAAIAQKPPSQAEQGATQVNFQLTSPVTAAAGQTMLLPFLDREIPAKPVVLYQPDVDPLHPLVAVLLTNDTKAAWPAGLATLYQQGGFVGDARLPATQADEQRLVRFAVDLGVRVDASFDTDVTLVTAKAAHGVMTLTRRERNTTTYRITTTTNEPRTVLIEQPRRPGWEVAEPGVKQVEIAEDHWRFVQRVEASAMTMMKVVIQHPMTELVALTDQSSERLLALTSGGSLPHEQVAALHHLADLRADQDVKRIAVKDVADQIQIILLDQDRVRKNLGAVPPNSDLQRSYLSQMQSQERDFALLRTKQDDARQQANLAEAKLRDAIAGLDF